MARTRLLGLIGATLIVSGCAIVPLAPATGPGPVARTERNELRGERRDCVRRVVERCYGEAGRGRAPSCRIDTGVAACERAYGDARHLDRSDDSRVVQARL